ncbi:MAG: hypothetical protein U0930_22670 [Pirellulales bacterium]
MTNSNRCFLVMQLFRPIFAMVFVACALAPATSTRAQETKIWEYSPYDVQIWYHFDGSVPVSKMAQSKAINDLVSELERTYRATWRIAQAETPAQLLRESSRRLADVQTTDLSRNEYVLVVSTTKTETKTVRSFEAAAESLQEIMVSPTTFANMSLAASQEGVQADSLAGKLLAKMKVDEQGDDNIINGVKTEATGAAFLPRYKSEGITKTRVIPSPLPWQTDRYFNEKDKIFFVNFSMNGDDFQVSVRELDCPMLHMGPYFTANTTSFSQIPHLTSHLMQRAFAPTARVEEAGTMWADLRHRAGGLIVDDSEDGHANPARITVGDLLHPFVRRDDRNGLPILLQPLTFTYASITNSDGVKMKCNVYTYSGGPGLQGKPNKRTHRILLRVRPAVPESDLRVVVRGNTSKSQPGCFIYSKDFLTEEFTYIGRTDWRGRLSIPHPESKVSVLPDELRVQRFTALSDARKKAIEAAQKEYDEAVQKAKAAGLPEPKQPENPPVVTQAPIDPSTTIPLNQPLMILYVKSGDTVLAKLPFIPGLREVDVAELLDDTMRLQTEALVRGFQSKILDQIGLRNLYAARAKMLIKKGDIEQATKFVDKLRKLKDFNEMNDELSRLERQILEQISLNPPPRAGQLQIDKMFKSTRDMLQKHLQDNLAGSLSEQLRQVQPGS